MYSSRPSPEKGKTTAPLVLHVDMDAFFASVEIRSDPRLQGMPVVVGGGPVPRGVVTAASYPSRRFGIRSGMPMAKALALCPELIALPVNPAKVVHESLAVLRELEAFSREVDPASIDEAYVHFEPVPRSEWAGRAAALATQIQIRVHQARGLTCSIGAGVNRLQAKMASARRKPFGITVVPPGSFVREFGRTPVSAVPGIGERTTERLGRLGVLTLSDMASAPRERLASAFGPRYAAVLHDLARGWDHRVAHFQPQTDGPKSASHEMTFGRDVADPGYLQAAVSVLADRVGRRLRRGGLCATVVGVRYTVGRDKRGRQRKLQHPTDRGPDLAAAAWPLLCSVRGEQALRLVGVAAMDLIPAPAQTDLFRRDRRLGRLIQVGDRLRDRFGEHALVPARSCAAGAARGRNRLRGWHAPEND